MSGQERSCAWWRGCMYASGVGFQTTVSTLSLSVPPLSLFSRITVVHYRYALVLKFVLFFDDSACNCRL